jgi:hypothetical protein
MARREVKEVEVLGAQMIPNGNELKAPNTLRQHVYSIIKAYRHAKLGEVKQVRRIARVYDPILQLIVDDVVDLGSLCDFSAAKLNWQIEEHIDAQRFQQSEEFEFCEGLYRWRQLWSVKGKRFGARNNINASGAAPSCAAESVDNLL